MLPEVKVSAVYLHRKPVDMRKQMDGLSAIVEGVMKQNPFSGALFCFINKRRDKLKILWWQRNGFIVWYKRIEQEKFSWPVKEKETVVTLSREQLDWLLAGYDVWKMKPHQKLNFSATI
jgi:transposase